MFRGYTCVIRSVSKKFVQWVSGGVGVKWWCIPPALLTQQDTLTFSRSPTALGEGQTSCISFLWNPFSSIVKMEIDQQFEQMLNIKFLVKLGKKGPEIHQMLQQVYGEYALKERTVFKWVQRFREGREDPKDNESSGRLST